jgi:hypothetical protein
VCYDNATPANLVYLQVGYPQVAANGDIGFAWIGTKTGHCLISALSAGPAGYTTVQGAGTGAIQRGTLNFTGTGVSVSDVSGKTQVSITAGSGGAAIASGTYAGIPTCDSAANGELYIFTDAIYTHATCNGTAWTYYREGKAVGDPSAPSWTWVNQASGGKTAAVDSTFGGVYLSVDGTGGDNWRIRKITAPSCPYTVTAQIIPQLLGSGAYPATALFFRESGTGKLVDWNMQSWVISASGTLNAAAYLNVEHWSGPTAYVGGPLSQPAPFLSSARNWLRIAYDCTNLAFYISADGSYWSPAVYTEAKNAYFTTAPDEIGFGINCQTGTLAGHSLCNATLASWKVQ